MDAKDVLIPLSNSMMTRKEERTRTSKLSILPL